MNWAIYAAIAFGGLVVGSLTSWILTEMRYYGQYNRLKDKAQADLAELKSAIAGNILGLADNIKRKLNEAVAEHGDNAAVSAMRDSFVSKLDEALAKADGNPILLSRVAKECFPAMFVAIGSITAAVEETRRTRGTYDKLSQALTAVGSEFWRMVQAVVGQGATPEELAEVSRRLEEAHRALGEYGLAEGLPALAEVFQEMSRLVEHHLPAFEKVERVEN